MSITLLILIISIVIALLVAGPAAAQEKESSASRDSSRASSLHIEAPQKVKVGEPIAITLSIRDAVNVAGYETNFLFDTDVAEFDGLRQRGYDLGSEFGRGIGPLGAVEIPQGISFGAYSCPVQKCLSTQGRKSTRGGRGDIRLATVSLIANKPGTLEISLGATKFVDHDGRPVENVDLSDSELAIRVGKSSKKSSYPAPDAVPWTLAKEGRSSTQPSSVDLTGDGSVTHADAMETAVEWTLEREVGNPCEDLRKPSRDVNSDGCIDVADLQMIVANYGTNNAREGQPADQASATMPWTASLVSVVLSQLSSLLDWATPQPALAAEGSTFTVNAQTDGTDANPGDGVCATATGECTLRAAIIEANRHQGPDTIAFNIPGTGVRTIQLASQLPNLNDASGPTTIDGYTQPGSAPNTHSSVSNAAIRVQIAGTGHSSSDFNGLFITSSGNTIRGLAFFKLKDSLRMFGTGAYENVVVGNFLGTDAAGQYRATSVFAVNRGVEIQQGAARNRIGGTSAADRNVVSGNAQMGISTHHEGSSSNVIINNLVGLNPAGNARLSNVRHGIDINTISSNNVIGGNQPGERNVVSGNGGDGVEISHHRSTVGNRVVGNFIGTDVTGNRAPAFTRNGGIGMRLEDAVRDNLVADNVIGNNDEGGVVIMRPNTSGNRVQGNRIGISLDGTAIGNRGPGIDIRGSAVNHQIGPNNIVAHNTSGIQLIDPDTDFNTITRNSIFGNTSLGIDIRPALGVNANDTDDLDSGANEQLNFPVLTSATPQQVKGTACKDAVVPKPCTIEIFVSDNDGTDHGQGKTFIGSSTTNTSGAFAVSVSGVTANERVTATATDAQGNTSEFSRNLVVEGGTSSPSDTEAPATTATPSPGPNGAGWNKENVTVTLQATDNEGGSGVKHITYSTTGAQSTASTTVPGNSAQIDITTQGITTITYSATDNAGNTETDKTLTIRIDKTKPTITLTTPPNGATYELDEAVNAGYTCKDDEAGSSGMASCAGPVPDGSPIDTASTGSKVFTVEAADKAGNTSSVTHNYTVSEPATSDPSAFSEDWTGSDGSPWASARWTTHSGQFGTLDIRSNEGRLAFANGNNAFARAIATMSQSANTETLVSFRFPSTESAAAGHLQIFSRASGDWVGWGPNNGYYVQIGNTTDSVSLRHVSDRTATSLIARRIGEVTTQKQWLRFRVEGTSLKVKVWTDGTPEPSAWEMETTSTLLSDPGVLQLRWVKATSLDGGSNVRLDDLKVTDLGP